MFNSNPQQRSRSSSAFDRARAVLCLLLLLFTIGHTVVGHAQPLQATTMQSSAVVDSGVLSAAPDSPDDCALCVAFASAIPLYLIAISIPQAAQPRPPATVVVFGPLPGWHSSLSCRPPPVA